MALRENRGSSENGASTGIYYRADGLEMFYVGTPPEELTDEFNHVAKVDGSSLPFTEGRMYDPLSLEDGFRHPENANADNGRSLAESLGKGTLGEAQQRLDEYDIFESSGTDESREKQPIVR